MSNLDLEPILAEMDKALNAGAYHLAITLALSLPDICSALEQSDGRTKPSLYRDWYNVHLAASFSAMSADDCYSLRCGVLHQGQLGIMQRGAAFTRVLFFLPDPQQRVLHNCTINNALQFDATLFCSDVARAVRSWFAAKGADAIVQANLPNLLQYRPNGHPNYAVGVPMIA